MAAAVSSSPFKVLQACADSKVVLSKRRYQFVVRVFVFLSVVTFGCFLQSSAYAQFKKAEEILWQCDDLAPGSAPEKSISQVFCLGYMAGVNEMMTILMGNELGSGLYCPPASGLSNDQARRIVVRWIKDHPEQMQESARMTALFALLKTFPCASAEAKPPPTGSRKR